MDVSLINAEHHSFGDAMMSRVEKFLHLHRMHVPRLIWMMVKYRRRWREFQVVCCKLISAVESQVRTCIVWGCVIKTLLVTFGLVEGCVRAWETEDHPRLIRTNKSKRFPTIYKRKIKVNPADMFAKVHLYTSSCIGNVVSNQFR